MTDEKITPAENNAAEPKKTTNWKSSKTYYMARLAILVAITIIMAFTPLGYLKVGAIEITFLTIPVIIGAIWLGPSAGAILGGIFGLTSFIQCFGLSALGVLLLEINPIKAFIVCFFPRLLMGWLVGVVFKAMTAVKPLRFSAYTVSSFLGAALNTCFFMTALIGLYGQAELTASLNTEFGLDFGNLSVIQFAAAFVGINALIELVVCAIIGMSVSRILAVTDKRSIEKAKQRSEKEAAELAAKNERLESEKELVEEENKTLKEKLMDKLDKDDNGKIDLFEPRSDDEKDGE